MSLVDLLDSAETSSALGRMLSELPDLLIGTCTITRNLDGAQDELGNTAKNPVPFRQGVKCLKQPEVRWSRFKELSQIQQVRMSDVVFLMEHHSDFEPVEDDRITEYTVKGIVDSNSYDIVAVLDDPGERDHLFIAANVVKAG